MAMINGSVVGLKPVMLEIPRPLRGRLGVSSITSDQLEAHSASMRV